MSQTRDAASTAVMLSLSTQGIYSIASYILSDGCDIQYDQWPGFEPRTAVKIETLIRAVPVDSPFRRTEGLWEFTGATHPLRI